MEQNGNIKPNKYNHGKIYKLVDSSGFYYVGSTCNSLSKRLSEHKATSKRDSNRKVYKQITNWNDIIIVLIVEVNVVNKEQLLRAENEYIDRNDPFCLNSRKALTTEEELQQYRQNYYKENKEQIQQHHINHKEEIQQKTKIYYNKHKQEIQQYKQQYRNVNKEKIKIKRSQLIKCICGLEITKDNFKRHTRSKKHQQFINHNEHENVSL